MRHNRLVPIFILVGEAQPYDQLTVANCDVRRVLATLGKEDLSRGGRARLDAIVRDEAALEASEAPKLDLRRRAPWSTAATITFAPGPARSRPPS